MEIEKFVGVIYEQENTENGDEFCSYLDYTSVKKKEFMRHHWETLKLDGSCLYQDVYKFVRRTNTNLSVFEFKRDHKFWENSPDEGWKQCWLEFQNNSLIYNQKGTKKIRVVRTFDDTRMLMTISCEDILTKKFFRAVGKDNAYNNEDFGSHGLSVSRNVGNFL